MYILPGDMVHLTFENQCMYLQKKAKVSEPIDTQYISNRTFIIILVITVRYDRCKAFIILLYILLNAMLQQPKINKNDNNSSTNQSFIAM